MPDWQTSETLDYVSTSAIENINAGVEELEQLYVGFSSTLGGEYVVQLELLKDALQSLRKSIEEGKEKLNVIQENRDSGSSSNQ